MGIGIENSGLCGMDRMSMQKKIWSLRIGDHVNRTEKDSVGLGNLRSTATGTFSESQELESRADGVSSLSGNLVAEMWNQYRLLYVIWMYIRQMLSSKNGHDNV